MGTAGTQRDDQRLVRLDVLIAFIRMPNEAVRRVRTPTLPATSVSSQQLAAVQEYYLEQYFRPVTQHTIAPTATAAPAASSPKPSPIRRHHPDEQFEESPEPAAETDAAGTGTVFASSDRLRRYD